MQIGDLISYSHLGYTHWAMYRGKNKKGQDTVVEFTGESGPNSKAGAKVKESLLKPGYKVDNSLDRQYTARSEAEMSAAMTKVLSTGAKPYGVFDNNCEHLVTCLRYGKPISLQVQSALKTQAHFQDEIAGNLGASHH